MKTLTKLTVLAVLGLCIAGCLAAAEDMPVSPDPQKILAASDAVRNPDRPF
jgi:hypothetical protein